MIAKLITRNTGQGMVEYALIVGFMVAAVIAGMAVYGATLEDLVTRVGSLW